MGEDAILQIGVATYSLADFRMSAGLAVVGAAIVLLVRGYWNLCEWRIRRAKAKGDHSTAKLIGMGHPEAPPVDPVKAAPLVLAAALVGYPAWVMFLENFEAELEQSLGAGGGPLAQMIAAGFAFALVWARRGVRRNFMAPDDLAALDKAEERQSWLRAFFREPEPGLGAGIGIAVVSIVAVAAILIVGWPG